MIIPVDTITFTNNSDEIKTFMTLVNYPDPVLIATGSPALTAITVLDNDYLSNLLPEGVISPVICRCPRCKLEFPYIVSK